MFHVIDLDSAASAIAEVRKAWTVDRIVLGPTLWGSEADELSERPLTTDRGLVADPFVVAVSLFDTFGDEVGGVEIFAGGWAELWLLADGAIERYSCELEGLSDLPAVLGHLRTAFAYA